MSYDEKTLQEIFAKLISKRFCLWFCPSIAKAANMVVQTYIDALGSLLVAEQAFTIALFFVPYLYH